MFARMFGISNFFAQIDVKFSRYRCKNKQFLADF